MAPIPIGLLIPGSEPVKIVVLAMILLEPHPVRLVLSAVPFMVVPVLGIAIAPRILLFVSVALLLLPLVLLFLPLVVSPVGLGIHRGNR
jgi:hypothetical protein